MYFEVTVCLFMPAKLTLGYYISYTTATRSMNVLKLIFDTGCILHLRPVIRLSLRLLPLHLQLIRLSHRLIPLSLRPRPLTFHRHIVINRVETFVWTESVETVYQVRSLVQSSSSHYIMTFEIPHTKIPEHDSLV